MGTMFSGDNTKIHYGDGNQIVIEDGQFHFSSHDGEHSFSLKPEAKGVKISWKPTGLIPGFNESGGFDFSIILCQKPKKSSLEFTLKSKNIAVYPQLPLSQEELEMGYCRPQYAINSMAFYSSIVGNVHNSPERASRYKTGKIGHLYRLKARDANGWLRWVDWHKVSGDKLLLVIDEDYLNRACYPIIIEPVGDTFGFTSAGASMCDRDTNNFGGSLFTGVTGIATSIHMYARNWISGDNTYLKGIIVKHSDLTIISNGVSNAVQTLNYQPFQWYQADFGTSPDLDGSDYVLGLVPYYYHAFMYDTGDANQGHWDDSNSYASPTNPTDASHNTNKLSIYVTYSPAGKVSSDGGIGVEALGSRDSIFRDEVEGIDYYERRISGQIATLEADIPDEEKGIGWDFPKYSSDSPQTFEQETSGISLYGFYDYDGQTFNPEEDHFITEIQVRMSLSTFDGILRYGLWSVSGGVPTGNPLIEHTLNPADWGSGYAWRSFPLSFFVHKDTDYAFCIYEENHPNNSGNTNIEYYNHGAGEGYSRGTRIRFNGSGWEAMTYHDLNFKVIGTPYTLSNPEAVVATLDTGLGTDTTKTLLAILEALETSIGTDVKTELLKTTEPKIDSGSGTDLALLEVVHSRKDTGLGQDLATILAVILLTDTGSGGDSLKLNEFNLKESVTVTELVTELQVVVDSLDSGIGVDLMTSLILLINLIAVDNGIGIDTIKEEAIELAVDNINGLDAAIRGSVSQLLHTILYTQAYRLVEVFTKPHRQVTIYTNPYRVIEMRAGMTRSESTFQRGETVPLWAEVKDQSGNYVDPTSVKLTLVKPDGTDVFANQDMVKSVTGKFVYFWNSTSDSDVGWYTAKGKTTDGTGEEAKVTIENGGFTLE